MTSPAPHVIAPVARNGQTGSEYQSATAAGKSTARPRYLASTATRLAVARTSTGSRVDRSWCATAGADVTAR
jgi:hypothetical protein